jgi:hypothetical protein
MIVFWFSQGKTKINLAPSSPSSSHFFRFWSGFGACNDLHPFVKSVSGDGPGLKLVVVVTLVTQESWRASFPSLQFADGALVFFFGSIPFLE